MIYKDGLFVFNLIFYGFVCTFPSLIEGECQLQNFKVLSTHFNSLAPPSIYWNLENFLPLPIIFNPPI